MIESDLYQFVTEHPRLVNQIGPRFYPLVLPQNVTYPAGRYQRITTPRLESHSGPSDLAAPRFQIDWWSPAAAGVSGFRTVSDLADACRKALDGFSGLMGTTKVYRVAIEDERDLMEDDPVLFRVSQDFVIWHRED